MFLKMHSTVIKFDFYLLVHRHIKQKNSYYYLKLKQSIPNKKTAFEIKTNYNAELVTKINCLKLLNTISKI